jgi:hypothetical protein
MRRLAGMLAAVAVLAAAPAARAATPQEQFQELFGAEASQVALSYGKKDDADFAAKLLKHAESLKDSPDLQVLVYERAYEFGLASSEGLDTARRAMTLLADLRPDRKPECEENTTRVYQAAYRLARTPEEKKQAGEALVDRLIRVGDGLLESGKFAEAGGAYRQAQSMTLVRPDQAVTLRGRLKRVTARQVLAQKVADLKGRLEANPAEKAAAREIALLLVVEMDKPEAAAPYAEIAGDAALQNYVLVAAMKPENLPEKACFDLGEWYKDLALGASDEGKGTVLKRSKAYLERFLAVHETQDAPRLKAQMILGQVTEALARLEPASAPTPVARPTPERISSKTYQFARLRSRLPPDQQIAVTTRKLQEMNGGKVIRLQARPYHGRITDVDLGGNPELKRIDPLLGWPMDSLSLRECVSLEGDLQALKGTGLTRLYLQGCRSLQGLHGVEGLPLEYLNITDCVALQGDLSALKGMKLERLMMDNCKNLESLNGLQGMHLKDLSLRGCAALKGDLSGLKGNPLVRLDLAGCENLESLRGIEGMPIMEIYLRGCTRLKGDLSALRGMKLERLLLGNCQALESLNGLQGMPLERLDLTDCWGLKGNLAPLKGMKLKFLSLDNCRSLEDLDGLQGMPLATLDLRGLKALRGDLTGLKGATIERLSLSGCESLESLKGVEDLPLGSIHVRGCPKIPREELLALGRIATLQRILLDDPQLMAEILRGRRPPSP